MSDFHHPLYVFLTNLSSFTHSSVHQVIVLSASLSSQASHLATCVQGPSIASSLSFSGGWHITMWSIITTSWLGVWTKMSLTHMAASHACPKVRRSSRQELNLYIYIVNMKML
ncbi:hypothetical protein XENOCAPTIV_025837 [Xenoophorus captivus]|uniref:Uncharacterized protein n=1 Tax=Xenoophorus captivus TaxID=1517983 RepID=A0ABV0QY64_9TELE